MWRYIFLQTYKFVCQDESYSNFFRKNMDLIIHNFEESNRKVNNFWVHNEWVCHLWAVKFIDLENFLSIDFSPGNLTLVFSQHKGIKLQQTFAIFSVSFFSSHLFNHAILWIRGCLLTCPILATPQSEQTPIFLKYSSFLWSQLINFKN